MATGTTAINKDGQIIGRKGAESRARLLAAARELLTTLPVQKLTASAIARAASLASQTFYLYFRDVDELLLQLCAQVAEDAHDVAAALDAPWDSGSLLDHTNNFVTAFYRYWDRHRPVLAVRNFLADHGHQSFEAMRNSSSLPFVQKIAGRIGAAHGDALTPKDALARAIIIFAAIERMAARYSTIETNNAVIDGASLKRAEAHILSLLLTRVTVDPK